MPITPTNVTKSSTSYINEDKASVGTWGDLLSTWGDSLMTWGGIAFTATNVTKSVTSFTNQTKS